MSQGQRSGRVPTVSIEEWTSRLDRVPICRAQMNDLVMGWLAMEGLCDAAAVFETEACVVAPVPLETMAARVAVRDAIQRGDVPTALAAVPPEVLDANPDVVFSLRIQHLIEVIRANDVTGAMDYARHELAPLVAAQPSYLPRLERVVSMLAFERAEECPSADVLSTAHRQHTAAVVNAALLRAHGLEPTSQLESLVKLMMWSQGKMEERAVFPHLNVTTGQLAFPE